jgi:hypothetical protein
MIMMCLTDVGSNWNLEWRMPGATRLQIRMVCQFDSILWQAMLLATLAAYGVHMQHPK